MKKVKGFTLIELIVVIAIIGILAAILIPSLTSYIKDARISNANAAANTTFTNLSTIGTKIQIAGGQLNVSNATGGTAAVVKWTMANPQKIGVKLEAATFTDYGNSAISAENLANLLQLYQGGNGTADDSGGYFRASFDSLCIPVDVAWAASADDVIVGQHPVGLTDYVTGGIKNVTLKAVSGGTSTSGGTTQP